MMKKTRKNTYLILILLVIMLIPLVNNTKPVKGKEIKQVTSSKECKLCHVQLYFNWSKTPHYQGFKELSSSPKFDYRSECEVCHNTHAKRDEILIPVSFQEANQKCGDKCHFKSNNFHNGEQITTIKEKDWLESNHGQGNVACTQCHRQHQSEDQNLQSREFCLNCHGPTNVISYSNKTKEHYAEKNCINCHNPHKNSLDLNLFKRKYRHYPVAKNKCFECHSPHKAFGEKLTKNSGNNVCYKCHGAKEYVFTKTGHAKAQGIIGKGLCINCHTPHSAEYQPLLRKEISKLCRSCHVNYGPHHFLGNIELQKEIDCLTCHYPHGGANKASLKIKAQNICKQCHEQS